MFRKVWDFICGNGDTEKKIEEILLGGSDHENKVSIKESELTSMTKKAIDEWAAGNGVNLDRRHTKTAMIEELKKHVNVT